MTTASPNQLTQEEFESVINAATLHDIANAELAFSSGFTEKVVPFPYFQDNTTGSAEDDPDPESVKNLLGKAPTETANNVKAIIKEQEQSERGTGDNVEGNTRKRVNGIQGKQDGISQEEFEKRIKEDEDRDVEDYRQRRQKISAELIAASKKHPESKELLLQVSAAVSKFFTNIWNKIVDFFHELIKRIVEWLTKAWEKVVNFFGGIIDFFKRIF